MVFLFISTGLRSKSCCDWTQAAAAATARRMNHSFSESSPSNFKSLRVSCCSASPQQPRQPPLPHQPWCKPRMFSTTSAISRRSYQTTPNTTTAFSILTPKRNLSINNDINNSQITTTLNNNMPLFLWIDPLAGVDDDALRTTTKQQQQHDHKNNPALPILVPSKRPQQANVTTPQEALQLVHEHYSMEGNILDMTTKTTTSLSKQQFVGGMGENDAGVAFCAIASSSVDILQFQCAFLHETMELIRQERHGIPITIYTTGLLLPPYPSTTTTLSWQTLGMDVLQVSLLAGTPVEYAKVTQRSAADFGQVCGFVAQALEENVAAVEVGVLSAYASSGRSLAQALGAQQVHVYPNVE